eukprot:jgi/Mesen1/9383/ME000610S08687
MESGGSELPVSVQSSGAAGAPVTFYADEVNYLKDEKAQRAEESYRKAVEECQDEDFTDLEELEFWQEQGIDLKGHQIVRIVGKFLPVRVMDMERLRRYIYRKMHDRVAAEEDTCVVYIHTDVSGEENSPGVMWLRSVYESLPSVCKDRVKAMYILHPALRMRVTLWGLGSWFSEGLYSKITFVSRVEFLWDYIRKTQLDIPEFVQTHDNELEHRPLMDYGIDVDPITAAQVSPFGAMGPSYKYQHQRER